MTDVRTPTITSVDRTELARLHDSVVCEAVDGGVTPLPARAGQSFVDDARCVERLIRCEAQLHEELARLEGLVEMSVLARMQQASLPQERPSVLLGDGNRARRHRTGRAYLEARRAHDSAMSDLQQRAASAAAELTRLGGRSLIVKESNPRLHGRRTPSVAVSHLVKRDQVDAYRRAYASARVDGLESIVVNGPSAPYSFTGLDNCA